MADWLSVPNGVNTRASNVPEAPLKAIGAPINLVGTPLMEIGSPLIVTGCPSTLLTPDPKTLEFMTAPQSDCAGVSSAAVRRLYSLTASCSSGAVIETCWVASSYLYERPNT